MKNKLFFRGVVLGLLSLLAGSIMIQNNYTNYLLYQTKQNIFTTSDMYFKQHKIISQIDPDRILYKKGGTFQYSVVTMDFEKVTKIYCKNKTKKYLKEKDYDISEIDDLTKKVVTEFMDDLNLFGDKSIFTLIIRQEDWDRYMGLKSLDVTDHFLSIFVENESWHET